MTFQRPAESQDAEETVPQILWGPDSGDFDAVWHSIESGLNRIMFGPTCDIDIPSLVGLYTDVHNYCTSQKALRSGSTANRGAHLLGEELYKSCTAYLHQYLGTLKQRLKAFSGQMLLDRYLDECAHYTNAAQIAHHVFRYLNRHWIKRELDEGKKSIYDIYTLHLVLWHGNLFKEISHQLVDAVSELVEKHRKGETVESGTSNTLIEFIVSLGPDNTALSSPVRDSYGNILETPLRIAIEAFDDTDPSTFLYERPITAFTHINEPARTEMEERLGTLVLHSGFKRPLAQSSHDTGTIKLVTDDLAVVETDQKAAERSFLIRNLCAHFGREIIARETIPLPNMTEPVLRKILEWCERHKNDPDTNDHARRYGGLGMDEWDQRYFQVDQEMVFEIINAANYLDIESLLDQGCRIIANMIKGKTPDEIRETFNITNDFTPEEEEQIRRENEWAEDRDSYIDWTDRGSSFSIMDGSTPGQQE